MKVRYHLLSSSVLVLVLYRMGFGPMGITAAMFFTILPDIDHLLMGRKIGTFYPPTVYDYYKGLRARGIVEPASSRFIGLEFPLHNVFVAGAAMLVYVPAGAGLILHQALDLVDFVHRGDRKGAF